MCPRKEESRNVADWVITEISVLNTVMYYFELDLIAPLYVCTVHSSPFSKKANICDLNTQDTNSQIWSQGKFEGTQQNG